jgi:hypothetical protein
MILLTRTGNQLRWSYFGFVLKLRKMLKHRRQRNILIFIILASVAAYGIPVVAHEMVKLDTEIRIDQNCDESEAELQIRVTIPVGTPLEAQADIIDQLMAFYKSLWTGKNPVLKAIIPQDRMSSATDMVRSSQAISGVDTILSVNRAFRQVEERGYVSFPEELTLISSEKFPLQIKCLLNSDSGKTVEDPRVQEYSDLNKSAYKRKQLTKNLNNVAVALVSFRSEFSRFPVDLTELKHSGHLQISIINPYKNEVLKFDGETGSGTISYSRPSEGRFALTSYDYNNNPVKRELIVGPDNSVRGVLSIKKPAEEGSASFTKQEQTVRINIFQIGQLLNSFYETYHYLPKSISHIEAQGFGSVNFKNPFTNVPIDPSMKIDAGKPGQYSYWVIGEGEYLLVGFGQNGRKVIEIHRKFIGKLGK